MDGEWWAAAFVGYLAAGLAMGLPAFIAGQGRWALLLSLLLAWPVYLMFGLGIMCAEAADRTRSRKGLWRSPPDAER